jgi:phosphoadenosine phosphosulfate reductase
LKSSLNDKINKSKSVLKQALDNWGENLGVLCNFGNECVVVTHLLREINGNTDFPIIFIDHGQHFPEIYEFKEKLSNLWNLKIISVKPKKEYDEVKGDKKECCYWLKTEPFQRAVNDNQLKAVCIPAHPDDYSIENVEKGEEEKFHRVYPISDWSENEIWRYIRINKLPYCSIYDKGYTALNCKNCSKQVMDFADELKEEKVDEDEIVNRLHKLGYF